MTDGKLEIELKLTGELKEALELVGNKLEKTENRIKQLEQELSWCKSKLWKQGIR